MLGNRLLSGELNAGIVDRKRDDGFVDGAATVLRDAEGSAHFHAVAILAHQDDRVRVREYVAGFDTTFNQFVNHHFVAGVKQQAADVFMVVSMLVDRFRVLPKLCPE